MPPATLIRTILTTSAGTFNANEFDAQLRGGFIGGLDQSAEAQPMHDEMERPRIGNALPQEDQHQGGRPINDGRADNREEDDTKRYGRWMAGIDAVHTQRSNTQTTKSRKQMQKEQKKKAKAEGHESNTRGSDTTTTSTTSSTTTRTATSPAARPTKRTNNLEQRSAPVIHSDLQAMLDSLGKGGAK